jgi:hypothetical protein
MISTLLVMALKILAIPVAMFLLALLYLNCKIQWKIRYYRK